jgi:hypothetical protein
VYAALYSANDSGHSTTFVGFGGDTSAASAGNAAGLVPELVPGLVVEEGSGVP